MEVDFNSLEITVDENEFDDFYEETAGRKSDDDQEMKTVGNENEVNEESTAKHTETTKTYQKDLRLKINESKEKHEGKESGGRTDNDREKFVIMTRRPGANSRGKQRPEGNARNGKLYKPLDASEDLCPKILGREIAYRLGEKKVALIINVVRVLGFKCAMQILDDTRKIERRGGMLTLDGKRRRAPGGVYICCLKERGYATRKEIDSIFKDDREKSKEKIKRKRHVQAAKKRKEIESLTKLKKQARDFVKNKMDTEDGKENSHFTEGERKTEGRKEASQLSEGEKQNGDQKEDSHLSEGEIDSMSD